MRDRCKEDQAADKSGDLRTSGGQVISARNNPDPWERLDFYFFYSGVTRGERRRTGVDLLVAPNSVVLSSVDARQSEASAHFASPPSGEKKIDLIAQAWLLLLLLSAICNAYPVDKYGADDVLENPEKEDITTTILRMNNGSTDMLLEGDILVPKTRTAMKCLNKQYSCFWPKISNGKVGVPFVISNTVDDTEKSKILLARKGFEGNTCIRFVPYRAEKAYLSIEPKYGCFSLMGRVGDKQLVPLQRSGCMNNGIIQHELLHALGFYHEHTCNDLDQYVRINWENVQDYFLHNFKKMDTDNFSPYDYSSVMQYGKTAFGKKGAETITPIPDSNVPTGQKHSMSDTDILRVNKLYKC
ncbi:low choriolytic enzyme-like [Girardinichthys multiradiatus]|uniref:low choriolytic enzyme-like n=1 Tax=Girardinichthys multiradiatus TaxID=208333 RepID=UPI001FAD1416|nr:low choriolytic enzyme-like [Girardinichthys multiradiatus]